jgi:hypothetical protein
MKSERKTVARVTQENLVKLLENKAISVEWFNSLAPTNESVFADVSMAVLRAAGSSGKSYTTVDHLYELENNQDLRH